MKRREREKERAPWSWGWQHGWWGGEEEEKPWDVERRLGGEQKPTKGREPSTRGRKERWQQEQQERAVSDLCGDPAPAQTSDSCTASISSPLLLPANLSSGAWSPDPRLAQ